MTADLTKPTRDGSTPLPSSQGLATSASAGRGTAASRSPKAFSTVSRKVFTLSGELLFVMISSDQFSIKEWNTFFRKGFGCVVTEEPSALAMRGLNSIIEKEKNDGD